MKKFTYALIISLVLACLFCATVSAADIDYSGSAGTLKWELYDDGELVISGNADMPDYTTSQTNKAPWYGKRNDIEIVTIEKGVKSIGDYAFYGCTNLIDIDIPSSVKTIGNRAFGECKDLVDIRIPDTVTSLGQRIFINCTSLEEVKMPKNITSVNTSMFEGCTSLEDVTLPEKLEVIRSGAFEDCKALETLVLPYTLTKIGEKAFAGCTNLEEVYFLGDAPDLDEETGWVFEDSNALTIYYMDGATGFTKTVWKKYYVEEYDGDDYEYGEYEEEEEDEDDGWITNDKNDNKNNNKNNLDCGDLDDNGKINSKDLTILKNILINQKGFDADDYGYAPDIDDDGDITVVDYIILARHIDGWDDYEDIPW